MLCGRREVALVGRVHAAVPASAAHALRPEDGSRGCSASFQRGSRVSLLPLGGQEVVQGLGAAAALDTNKDVSEVGSGVDAEHHAAHQREQDCIVPGGLVGTDEKPVVLPKGLGPELRLLQNIADRPGAILQVGFQVRSPPEQRPTARPRRLFGVTEACIIVKSAKSWSSRGRLLASRSAFT